MYLPDLSSLAHAAVSRTIQRPQRFRLPYVLYGYANGDQGRVARSQIAADAALGFVLECLNPWPSASTPGAALQQMFSVLLADALWAMLPDQTALPSLSVSYQAIRLPFPRLTHLRDGAVVLVLAALDDGALQLHLHLRECDLGTVLLTLESDRPGIANDVAHDALAALQAALRSLDIALTLDRTDWSWQTTLVIPVNSEQEVGYGS